MLIRWSERASAEFDAIFDCIAEDSPQAAVDQVRRILSGIDQLRAFPISGPAAGIPHTRQLYVPGTPYIVYYRRKGNIVKLLSIRHASMRKPRRFKE